MQVTLSSELGAGKFILHCEGNAIAMAFLGKMYLEGGECFDLT